MFENPTIPILSTVFLAGAILHSFLVKRFLHLALKFPKESSFANLLLLLGEIEVVFGIWAALFLLFATMYLGSVPPVVDYLESLQFTEPLFVFVIMTISATRPILYSIEVLLDSIAKLLSFLLKTPKEILRFFTILSVGTLLGSFITEPAAMTVTALILKRYYFDNDQVEISNRFKYVTLAVLFVNISIGGVLTPYAAPPVLMVAATRFNWDLVFMLTHFGWKSIIAVGFNSLIATMILRKDLMNIQSVHPQNVSNRVPLGVVLIQLAFLFIIVLSSHYDSVFIGIFFFFLGYVQVTKKYQGLLRLQEALLVAFFLGGIVVLGTLQRWWLEPLLMQFTDSSLYVGAALLSAITDNAALTYLGAQVPNLTENMKYALVAGAVTGGGLTVIANAPNPAGFGILKTSFGKEGISPLMLLMFAVPPTIVAAVAFWFL